MKHSRPKKDRDLKYLIKAHMQRGGSKYISFVEKVRPKKSQEKKVSWKSKARNN